MRFRRWIVAAFCSSSALASAQVVTEFPTSFPTFGITAGADGNVWFTYLGADQIGRISPSGIVTNISAGISPGGVSFGITAGPDGNVWFAETATGKIARVTPGGVVTEFGPFVPVRSGKPLLYGICRGPDSNVWFTAPNS